MEKEDSTEDKQVVVEQSNEESKLEEVEVVEDKLVEVEEKMADCGMWVAEDERVDE